MSQTNLQDKFYGLFDLECRSNLENWFGEENWEKDRYGARNGFWDWIGPIGAAALPGKVGLALRELGFRRHLKHLPAVLSLLENEASRKTLVKILAYRLMGYRKIQLPLSNPKYWEAKSRLGKIADYNHVLSANIKNWKLPRFKLQPLHFPVELHSTVLGVMTIFYLKQYEYLKWKSPVKVRSGDIVIDGGGGWGDTALYFAHETGPLGKVFSFEFIPSNISIMEKNFSLNSKIRDRIQLIQNPLWSHSGDSMFCNDKGPASRVHSKKTSEYSIPLKTLTIDDFVREQAISRVDFIKMDIEGAELPALKGAEETIKRFRPALAISIYHRPGDFWEIPLFLSSLKGTGYKFFLDHFTIFSEETVLFAVSPRA